MVALITFLLGLAVGLGALLVLRRRQRVHEGRPAPPVIAPVPLLESGAVGELETLASSLGRELGDLATAVQGNAQLLCESLGEPELFATRCEPLWHGVHRLRLLSDKILTFAHAGPLEREPVEMRGFLEKLRDEIEGLHGSRRNVQLAMAPFLPPARADERSLHNALLFVVEALLEMQPNAHALSIAAYGGVGENDETSVEIEICAEAEESAPRGCDVFQLGYRAARRALDLQGGSLAIQQVAGVSATSFVSLEATSTILPEGSSAVEPVAVSRPVHEFGGVLVLEDDPAVRSMIAAEVERFGRNILSCVDAASARALLDATPERFELLILDRDTRTEEADSELIAQARLHDSSVRVLVLAQAQPHGGDLARCRELGLAVLEKPFDVIELRAVLDLLLGDSAGIRREVRR
jgi:CheY-like chemotaxis protein